MIIFGIDPGTAVTGYGIIRASGNRAAWVDSGDIRTGRSDSLPARLETIYTGLTDRMHRFPPDLVCVEQAFYAKNVHTTLILGHARGIALLAARQSRAEVAEYSPREIKKALVGSGNAAKEQVSYMVRSLLALGNEKRSLDSFDALAAALCGFNRFMACRALSGAVL